MKLWCLKILSRQLTRVWNRAFQVHSFVWCLMINKMSVPGKSFSKHTIIIFTFYLYTTIESLVWGLCSNEESFIVVHITNMYGCLLMSVACFCCFTRLSVKGLEQCNLTPSASLTSVRWLRVSTYTTHCSLILYWGQLAQAHTCGQQCGPYSPQGCGCCLDSSYFCYLRRQILSAQRWRVIKKAQK